MNELAQILSDQEEALWEYSPQREITLIVWEQNELHQDLYWDAYRAERSAGRNPFPPPTASLD